MKEDNTLTQEKKYDNLNRNLQTFSCTPPDGHHGYPFAIGDVVELIHEKGRISPGRSGMISIAAYFYCEQILERYNLVSTFLKFNRGKY